MLLAAILSVTFAADAGRDRPRQTPEEAVSAMTALLVAKDFTTFYRNHCHKHLRDQVGEEEFVQFMKDGRGAPMVDLLAEVDRAIREKKGKDVLVARPQKAPDQYEFLLERVWKRHPRKGALWRLELQKEDGRWKLMDTD